MNEPTLTDTERETLATWDNGSYTCPSDDYVCGPRCEPEHEYLFTIVARIKAEAVDRERASSLRPWEADLLIEDAVDRERAAWATKIETLLAPTYSSASDETWQVNGHIEAVPADLLRALLAADDTEAKP